MLIERRLQAYQKFAEFCCEHQIPPYDVAKMIQMYQDYTQANGYFDKKDFQDVLNTVAMKYFKEAFIESFRLVAVTKDSEKVVYFPEII